MPAQQIKAYVEVQSLAQLTQFKNVSGEQVVRAYQLTNQLRENICNLLSALAGQRGPYLITGARGVGKSHLIALIRALLINQGLAAVLRDPAISTAAGKLAHEKFFVMELYLDSEDPPDLLSLLREELATREHSALVFSDAEWEASMSGERIFKLIKSKLPPGSVMVLLIDGLCTAMRSSRRVRAQLIKWLNWAAERFREQNQALILTFDEDLLNETGNELIAHFKIERVNIINLRDIADRHIFKKNEGQRSELSMLYSDLLRLMPQFSWSREDFVALFPIHPAVLEVSPGLRTYSRSFTFFGFINASASRAMSRRAMNLSTLDELFDSFEFDLRKNDQLATVLAAYDHIIQQGIPKLGGFDEKLWAKLALKALFIFSLCGKAVTPNKLADSVMLYDDRDFAAAYQKVRKIVDCFAESAPEAIEVLEEGRTRSYRFIIESPVSPNQLLDDAAYAILDEDPRLGELLVGMGGECFSNWPLKGSGTQLLTSRAEFSLAWRGTMRRGLLKFGGNVELLPIESISPPITAEIEAIALGIDLATAEGLITEEDDSLPMIDVLVDTETELNPLPSDLSSNAAVCEWDWQISLIGINSSIPSDAPLFVPPTLFYWLPGRPSSEDIATLKRALALRLQGEALAKEGLDLKSAEQLNAEVRVIFRRLYIDGGRFRNPGSQRLILIDTPANPGASVIDLILPTISDALVSRYPQHPHFKEQLTEYEVLRLAVGLFGGLNPSSPIVQSYAETYALPMQLVSIQNGEYRLDLDNNTPYPAVAEVLRLVAAAEKSSVPMSEIYRTLRREPFGLQPPAQRLILLALIAAWRIELVDDTGNRALGASQLSVEAEFKQYTQVRVPATINYPPKLLMEWCALLTAHEGEVDLVSPHGRRQMRDALAHWRQNWLDLGLVRRLEDLPTDVLTTRLWQSIVTCKRYFEAISQAIEATLNEEIPLEMCLSRIIDTFNLRESVYINAVHELTMLINFLDWLPFYLETKNYILAAERTTDGQIEAERRELIGFLTQSQRLFDEEKRLRFETVYRSFHSHYIDFYCVLHDNIMGMQATANALVELSSSEQWRTFELLSQLSIGNRRYYRLAIELIGKIKESTCQLPTRDMLQHQPSCACTFRINYTINPAIALEVLKTVIEHGTTYHQKLLAQYRAQIGMLFGQNSQEAEQLKSLLAISNGEAHKITLSTIEALNEAFAKIQARTPIGVLPAVQLGGRTTKQELRERFERWIDSLPDEPEVSLEFLDHSGCGDE
ncbi:MAG: DUF6079 family protein [Acidobacteriota bacterium]